MKTFVVQALACFDSPSTVAASVKEEFDRLVVTRQRVHTYDPTKKAGEDLGAELKAIFEATRKSFLEEAAAIGIANKAVRLRKLNRVAEKAEAANNHMMVMSACEAAAKEVGDAFTNRQKHEHTGKDGKDLILAATIIQLPDNGELRAFRTRSSSRLIPDRRPRSSRPLQISRSTAVLPVAEKRSPNCWGARVTSTRRASAPSSSAERRLGSGTRAASGMSLTLVSVRLVPNHRRDTGRDILRPRLGFGGDAENGKQ